MYSKSSKLVEIVFCIVPTRPVFLPCFWRSSSYEPFFVWVLRCFVSTEHELTNPRHNSISLLDTLIPPHLPIPSSVPMKIVYNPGGFNSARHTEKYASGQLIGCRTRYTNAEKLSILSVVNKLHTEEHLNLTQAAHVVQIAPSVIVGGQRRLKNYKVLERWLFMAAQQVSLMTLNRSFLISSRSGGRREST